MPERAREGHYLGFDFGLARIGVAVGEPITGGARGVTTLQAQQGAPDWDEVAALIEHWRPLALVVGIPPQHADGTESPVARASDRFARRLAGRFALPVHRTGEAMTSQAARQRLHAIGRPARGRRDKHRIDSTAAAVILEHWFAEGGTA
ncbi:putative pre-16S rRNA nuclease [wastewater metagenome]|uniref:Putative pre-16S rRNA nuclease n=2 Tax=unclassified sequences TaxID=12908 RepID=A0A5B8RH08_9ZZZZ|nr:MULTISPECIES: Holliday junction resolvase RuvX [Arhodomonas]MCS4505563.1 Holliday junction resolvase RuvX [Arhodomonas aquaeolei]QEA07263.1 putative pre-16S rRNA nuclease [uncultured organism]